MRTPDAVVEQLERGPDVLAALLDAVPAADLKRRPAPGKWSAHEHACHVGIMEPMWRGRLERILAEDHPRIVSYEPAEDDPERLLKMDLAATMQAFRADRAALVASLRALPATAWSRPASHTSHARYGLFLMCRHVAMHDLLHAYRIEESALGTYWPGATPA